MDDRGLRLTSKPIAMLLSRCVGALVLITWLAATGIVAVSRTFGHSPDASFDWQVLDGSASARVLAQEHISGGARSQDGCERIVISAPAGQSAHLGCTVARVAVLDELEIRLWIKASRSHVQLAARVAMPRSVDTRGERATALVRGPIYNQPGHWQLLVLKDVPKLLAAEVRGAAFRPRREDRPARGSCRLRCARRSGGSARG